MKSLSKNFKFKILECCLITFFVLQLSFFMAVPESFGSYTAYVIQKTPPVGTTNLDHIETGTQKILYSHSFEIPYNVIEGEINQAIVNELNKMIPASGVEECSACPNIKWKITGSSGFSFTGKGQPQLSEFNTTSSTGLNLSLHTEAQLILDVHVEVWQDGVPIWLVPIDEEFNLHMPVNMTMDATGKFQLYPDVVKVDPLKIIFAADPAVEIDGISHTLAKAGALAGGAVGITPLGLATGGPAIWSTTMAVFGATAAADLVEEAIVQRIDEYVLAGAATMESRINNKLNMFLDIMIPQVNSLKGLILNSPIPGANQSVQQLMNTMGLTLDARAVTPAADLQGVITARYSGQGGGNALSGKLRIPRGACLTVGGTGVNQVSTTMIAEFNTDLKDKVGQSCSSVFPGQVVRPKVYLGPTPPGTNMAQWTNIGSFSLTGNLEEFGEYYECGYQISGLPAARIVRLEEGSIFQSRLPDHDLHTYLLFGSAAFDNLFKPVNMNNLILGGKPGGDTNCEGVASGPWAVNKLEERIAEVKNPPQARPGIDEIREQRGFWVKSESGIAAAPLGAQTSVLQGASESHFDQGTMQTRQGTSNEGGMMTRSGEGATMAKKKTESRVESKTAKSFGRVAVDLKSPNIIVNNVIFMPPPTAGKSTKIWVYFTNTGKGKISKGTEFTVKCKSAPKCFLEDMKVVFNKDIAPDKQYVWVHETKKLTAGLHKMEIITPSSNTKGGNKKLIILNASGMGLKKSSPLNLKHTSKEIKKMQPAPAVQNKESLKDKTKENGNVKTIQPGPVDPGTLKKKQ